ncbi:aldo/keto reductase [Falsiroseomonas tokyonensis]|uniref:Aldo/keto reductase n=1 Tax=Falsiroseomonas tokyonensis TaxID=430521 RepID=A0ABV7BZ94_9PROT|nr:aldo/keto reductase [Falsiroseomonas tokyonensis]MBU8539370.1 aldo/keto reductase [Falsiroseomonas tokyonensis]
MSVERFELAPGYAISRILRGGWQLAGGHGDIARDRAIAEMRAFVEAGVTTFDCADIYTGVEEMIGDFRATLSSAERAGMQVHTKFVPDWSDLPRVDLAYVTRIIDRSLQRLRTDRLDLVQFHWWNYATPGWVDAAQHLDRLRQQGKIRHVAGTNFDTPHASAMIEAGVPLVSMQVQYSLLDRRPAGALSGLCAELGMKLLCYGTVAGGFLSARWLGQPAPAEPLANRSLVKYRLIIEEFGGWDAFQALLRAMEAIARKHGVSITAVATRWVLDQPHVAGAIVGARYAEHLADNLTVFRFALDAADVAALEAVLAQAPGPAGDTYTLERDRDGPHGRIMKYDLNRD